MALGSCVGKFAVLSLGRCFCPFPGGPEGPGPWGTPPSPGLVQAAHDLAKLLQHPALLPGFLTVVSWCELGHGPEFVAPWWGRKGGFVQAGGGWAVLGSEAWTWRPVVLACRRAGPDDAQDAGLPGDTSRCCLLLLHIA